MTGAAPRLGIDVCSFERIAQAARRSGQGFLDKVYTRAELDYCEGRPERLAGRWAAKEAVIKCIAGTPLQVPRRRIEVLPDQDGAPRVRLLGIETGARLEVTITHEAGIAVAAALVELPAEDELLPPPPDVRIPPRPLDGHKGTFGETLVIAGSMGFTGAAYLAATAAARAGAGTVRLMVPSAVYPVLAVKCTEVMAMSVPDVPPGAFGTPSWDAIDAELDRARAVVCGPGLGRAPETWRMVRDLVARPTPPLVLDADALNAIAGDEDVLRRLGEGGRPAVLTPHPGEMARLVGASTADVQRDRPRVALDAARRWGAVVVLKGAHTIVAAPDGRSSVDPHQEPALATGGTGDVLCGLIGGLLSQQHPPDPFTAAVTGVYVHAASGRRIALEQGASGLLASDLLPVIPRSMQALRERGR